MSITVSQLSQHVAKALERAPEPAVLGYAWKTDWNEGEPLQVGDQSVAVRYCATPLAMREAMIHAADGLQVLLVGFPERELSEDLLARLFRHRLLHVDRWQLVADTYHVQQIDPRLYDHTWMPEALLEAAGSVTRQSRFALTFDEAMTCLLGRVFDSDIPAMDLDALLNALESREAAWVALAPEQREAFQKYLQERVGSVVGGVLGAVAAGNAHVLLAIGLTCEVLYSEKDLVAPELRDARVRLENRLGGQQLSTQEGVQWADAAIRVVLRKKDAERHTIFRATLDLIRSIGADDFLSTSSVLPESLDLRLETLSVALSDFLRRPGALPEVERACGEICKHVLLPPQHPGPETAQMVLRLCRREAQPASTATVALSVKEYVQHGAWEDWARRDLRSVRPEALSRSVSKLLKRINERRRQEDERFALEVARKAESDAVPAGVIPIETALDAVVAPLAQQQPVLLIVLDGMSWDVYLSIARQMEQTGWTAWKTGEQPVSLLATVPTVTECSRASLLAGRISRGPSNQEKQAFAAHEALKRHSRSAKPPLLLHKAELTDGQSLSGTAAKAVVDDEQRVVGVVINAIDDALAKSDQVRIDWSVEAIPLLGALLGPARSTGRAVVMTSDHGHVLEQGSVLRSGGDAERWRLGGDNPGDGEIYVDGPRVRALVGSSVTVPWTEAIRYASKKNGYHGGVTRQELIVPCGVWTTGSEPGPDYEAFYQVPPEWWDRSYTPVAAEPRASKKATKSKTKDSSDFQGDLFAIKAPRAPSWIDSLISSEALQAQRQRVGRTAMDDERLRDMLNCLASSGDRATMEQLASAVRQPMLRMRGVLSVMQRMLNVDGYPVVTVEAASNTVLLNVPLLKAQFQL